MGTRNVTIIKMNNEIVLTKYCQWDGYPSGQGRELHEFIKKTMNLRTLKANIKKCYEIGGEKIDELFDDYLQKRQALESQLKDYGFDYMDVHEIGRKLQRKLVPTLTRDTGGADFLNAIQEQGGLPITDLKGDLDYATGEDGMSFGCEYCYEVDLDAKKLSVYDGFYKGKPVATYTFAKLKKANVDELMQTLEDELNAKYEDENESA